MPGGAGPISLDAGPAVDIPAAKEFIDEVHRKVSREELERLVGELERKSAGFKARLGPEAIEWVSAEQLREVLASVFCTRRRVSKVLGLREDDLCDAVRELLYGERPVGARLETFCAAVDLPPLIAAELASELLHFTDPDRWWLWSRWIWNPDARTGALPLVLEEDYDLDEAEGIGDTYERLGVAMRALDASPEAASFRGAGVGALGTDVFLVTVYGVYMTTVLGLKMSQEFNSIVPPLPQLARRLLGTRRMEV